VTPHQYRELLDRAIRDGNSELLDACCAVLAENEAGKEILYRKGYGTAKAAIDATARLVPDNN
jgi:hypothetical protein